MIISEEVHHSIADADDLEDVWGGDIHVKDVFRNLARHPAQIILRWNWKSAMLSAVIRASFYFTVYKASKESWLVTMTAVLVEVAFRFLTTGIGGAVIQSFRKASPVWLAHLIVSIMLPAFSHTVEFVSHYVQEKYFYDIFPAAESSARQKAFAISVLFSAVSAMFNLFMMRNGVLLVGAGEETKSFAADLKSIPMMIKDFVSYLPDLIARSLGKGQILKGFGLFFLFGFSVGAILGTARFVFDWGWKGALGAWGFLLFCTIVSAIVRKVKYGKVGG